LKLAVVICGLFALLKSHFITHRNEPFASGVRFWVVGESIFLGFLENGFSQRTLKFKKLIFTRIVKDELTNHITTTGLITFAIGPRALKLGLVIH
jgi:hypothetical protein